MSNDHFSSWKQSHKGLQEAVTCSCISVQVSNHSYFAKKKKKISQSYHHECAMRPFCIRDYRADVGSASATGSLASRPWPHLDHVRFGEQWNWHLTSCLLANRRLQHTMCLLQVCVVLFSASFFFFFFKSITFGLFVSFSH